MRTFKPNHPAAALLLAAFLALSGTAAGSQGSSGSAQRASTAKTPNRTGVGKVSKKPKRRERGQKVPTPGRITEIQQALARDGSLAVSPSGKWDPPTIEAMKRFQDAHGLNPSGRLDAKTLHLLGLGAPTAGMAPPLPPVSSAAVTSVTQNSTRPR